MIDEHMMNYKSQEDPSSRRMRVLFIAEAVTLAHVARPVVLARSLDPAHYEVMFASAPRYESLFSEAALTFRPIHSISAKQFLDSLAKGQPLHSASVLRGYVKEEISLLNDLRPDAVIGDLRHSLAVSARLAGISYLTIASAYWSPYARQRFTVPELPLTRTLGVRAAAGMFRLVRPLAFASHCLPINQVRREHGMASIGYELRRMYTDADHVLYPEVPELVPTYDPPANHHYVGPLLWSPSAAVPPWWSGVPGDRPAVYVTLGSSGSPQLLSAVLEALADEPVYVIAATLGHRPGRVPANAFIADYLPGMEAAARSRVVVSNGGSPTSHQALAAGVPVLGLPSNMDQHLNSDYVIRSGAGEMIRSEEVTPHGVRSAISRLLSDPSYAEAAVRLSNTFRSYDPGERLSGILRKIRPERPAV